MKKLFSIREQFLFWLIFDFILEIQALFINKVTDDAGDDITGCLSPNDTVVAKCDF